MIHNALSSVDQYVHQKIASRQFSSREDSAREAFRVYRELEAQRAELQAEVHKLIAQVERRELGLATSAQSRPRGEHD